MSAGLAGGADVILIPEIPYDVSAVAESIRQRSRKGSRFSILAVSEDAMLIQQVEQLQTAERAFDATRELVDSAKKRSETKRAAKADIVEIGKVQGKNTLELSEQLEALTGLESRVTILGYLQRGGPPSAADRILITRLGTVCARLIAEDMTNIMVASRGETSVPVPIEEIVGRRKTAPLDHLWIAAARDIGVCLGNR